jgi:5-methylcytosine-specific restriction endonuclease McrA
VQTLVLTHTYQPHRVVSWQKAITMLFDGKVEVLSEYDEDIRSVSLTVKMPAVVRLVRHVRHGRLGVKFSRANVLARDGLACQYCGRKASPRELTFDHVLPRSQGGRTSWENIVTACRRCNARKGGRTPEQAHMALRTTPARPRELPYLHVRFELGRSVPEAWRSWMWWRSEPGEGG